MKTYGDIAFVVDEKLRFRHKAMAIAAVTVMSAWHSKGQSPQDTTAPAAPLAFEVASVKPVSPVIPTAGSPWIGTHGRFKADTAYIRFLVAWAYNVLAPQVQGGPDWIDQERYYVDARAENPEAGPEQIRAMLQTLLTDRFKLAELSQVGGDSRQNRCGARHNCRRINKTYSISRVVQTYPLFSRPKFWHSAGDDVSAKSPAEQGRQGASLFQH
jgi:hypothetical protein